MTPLLWTKPALADLRRIDAALRDRASAEIAIRTLQAIGRRADFLTGFPRSGRPDVAHGFGILRVIGTRYLIFYRMTDDRIELLRIRHERENWQGEPQ